MIINDQVFADATQTKFLRVGAERSPQGEPYLPAYLANRMYFDLSP